MLTCSDPCELEQVEGTWDLTASGLPQDLTEVSRIVKGTLTCVFCIWAPDYMQLLNVARLSPAVLCQSVWL